MSISPHLRQQIVAVLEAALRAVDPRAAVAAHVVRTEDELHVAGRTYRLAEIERVLVVGGGKAAAPMAAALAAILGDRIAGGVLNVKYGHTSPQSGGHVRFECTSAHRSSPLPAPTDPPSTCPENRPP
ncbi:MAG: glycerate-2-kinase family protein, partial [Anaerolineae bacterium]|nr:glycerate-2-kinase family protein [Anaerolineae bacterium]